MRAQARKKVNPDFLEVLTNFISKTVFDKMAKIPYDTVNTVWSGSTDICKQVSKYVCCIYALVCHTTM